MAEDSSDKMIYLHGDLDLTIVAARRLPNMDLASERFRRCFAPCTGSRARGLPSAAADDIHHNADDIHHTADGEADIDRKARHHGKIITSDPYVAVVVPQATVARTRVIPNSQNPKWDEHFLIPLAHPLVSLEFQVKDNDFFGAQLIGTVFIPASRIASGERIVDWFMIAGGSGNPPKPESALRLDMKFTPCEKNPIYSNGIGGDPEHAGVRNTYFPLRKGCSVKLYQDAHVVDNLLPDIELESGHRDIYRHGTCWEDICYAISEAHHLIYLVGWSIFHKIKLVREPTRPVPRGGDLTLGNLLRYKSEEGVRVLLLLWDDKTSHNKYFINTVKGISLLIMKGLCKLMMKKHEIFSSIHLSHVFWHLAMLAVVGTVFTHHQKCVLVDTQAIGNNRKITAFIGGLDLCDGRYDTPEHRLFRGLDTVFKDDFHNPTLPAGSKAPRQPWHDLHCKIEGPAAYDILLNFEQRWKRATRWKEFSLKKKMAKWHDDALIKIDRISWILSPAVSDTDNEVSIVPEEDPKLWVSDEKDPESWHVQVFRSIDSGSLKGFPKTVGDAHAKNLICSKNLMIDKSIQTAYVQAIRSAQHYIYIENQYFIGSSYGWPSYKNAGKGEAFFFVPSGADNLIPMELALKIVSKIKAKERFAVYVVIPLWPEGDPKSATVQEILYWQNQTMQMMYGIVARELKTMQLEGSHPQDYLNFYCLGNREEVPQQMLSEAEQSDANGAKANKVCDSMKNQRFMIYVHAKGMIVDDEYVILGSANINQRSLAGSKDTEIAMGAYQHRHTWGHKKKPPRGQVYGYRTSLWAEHLGMLEPLFNEPESLECVRKVNNIAEENWKRFTDENFMKLQGHLLRYPLNVDAEGNVDHYPNQDSFPDIGGRILGAPSPTLPDVLTT
ncbi:hypothetical protein V2J09_016261 [Rumex salicifolius]